jgi:hypothetical protein
MFTVPVFAAALSPVNIVFGIIFTVLGLAVLFRIGLLAHVAAQMVLHSLTSMPLTRGRRSLVLRSVTACAAGDRRSCSVWLPRRTGRPAFGVMEARLPAENMRPGVTTAR